MLDYIKARFNLAHGEEGATAIEYGLLAALIAAVIIGAVTLLGEKLNTIFTGITASI